MGGTPLFALALVGMPINKLPLETIRGSSKAASRSARDAGIPIAGGHSIDSVEPIYGLVGDRRSCIRGTSSATRARRPGDVLVLGKPLGVGISQRALKKDELDAAGLRAR